MKFNITFKNPDAVDVINQAIEESISYAISKMDEDESPLEKDLVIHKSEKEVRDIIKKYLTYNEYINIEFDTEKGTAKVI